MLTPMIADSEIGAVDDAHLAELLVQPLRHAERAAVRADVFAEHEHLRIAAHLLGERLADRFEVREIFAHTTSEPTRRTRRHEGKTPTILFLRVLRVLCVLSALRIQIRHRVFGRRIRRVHREFHRFVDDRRHPRLDVLLLLIVEHVARLQIGGERRDRIAALPHRQLFVGAVERLVVLRVAVPAVGLALDQRGTVAGPRPRDRPERRLIDREHVVAVDRDAVEPVASARIATSSIAMLFSSGTE